MKFYNPFKWHMFKTLDGMYYISKRGILFRYFVGLSDGHIWHDGTPYYRQYCYGSYDQVKSRLNFMQSSNFVE